MNATAAVERRSCELLGPQAPSPAFMECQVVGVDRFKTSGVKGLLEVGEGARGPRKALVAL